MGTVFRLSVSSDFSETLGARYKSDGEFSGEEFYEKHLKPLFERLTNDDILEINLDGVYFAPSSFLSESFGLLYKNHGGDSVWDKIRFISNDDPILIDLIKEYAQEHD